MKLFNKKPYFFDKKAEEQYKSDEKNTEMCQKAIAAYSKGDIEKTIKICEELLNKKFDGTYPYRTLCEIYHKKGKFQDEIRIIKCLRSVTPQWRYEESNKYRWYDKRYEELKNKR